MPLQRLVQLLGILGDRRHSLVDPAEYCVFGLEVEQLDEISVH